MGPGWGLGLAVLSLISRDPEPGPGGEIEPEDKPFWEAFSRCNWTFSRRADFSSWINRALGSNGRSQTSKEGEGRAVTICPTLFMSK